MADDPGAVVEAAMKAAGRALTQATKKGLVQSGVVARREMMKVATRVPGADRKFSRFKAPALKVTMRYEPDAVAVVPFGPWKLAETGAAAHSLAGGRVKKGHHPGTHQGDGSWTKGREATFVAVGQSFPTDVGKAVEGAFAHG